MTNEQLIDFINEEANKLMGDFKNQASMAADDFQHFLKTKIVVLSRQVEDYLSQERIVNKDNYMGITNAINEGLGTYKIDSREEMQKLENRHLFPKSEFMFMELEEKGLAALHLSYTISKDAITANSMDDLTTINQNSNYIATLLHPESKRLKVEMDYHNNFAGFIYELQRCYPNLTPKQISYVTDLCTEIRQAIEKRTYEDRLGLTNHYTRKLLDFIRNVLENKKEIIDSLNSSGIESGLESQFKQ